MGQSEPYYPKINRDPINFNAHDEHYKALKRCQEKYIKCSNTHKDSFSFPIESTVAVQCEDGGPWMYNIVEETNGTDHMGWSYIIRV